MTVDETTWRFIDEHQDDDVRQLALAKNKFSNIDIEFALRQIQGRQKAKHKLPSFFALKRFVFPHSVSMEQCSSEATARYKASLVSGNAMSDLSGGMGIDTWAFSTSFNRVDYVEPQSALCETLAHNRSVLSMENVQIHQMSMTDFLATSPHQDFVYVDPSRRDGNGNRVVTLEQCEPNVVQCRHLLLSKADDVMIKMSPMLDIKRALAQLPETYSVYVVAVNGECKELLFRMKNEKVSSLAYHTVNIRNEKFECFDFDAQEENDATPKFIDDTLDQYLYEPNAAIFKAGAFKLVSERFELKKLHPHSHLYTSNVLLPEFPGRVLEIQDVFPFNRKVLSERLKNLRQANVVVRNFPLSAEELKKDLKLADGGDVYIYGTTLCGDRKAVIQCRRER